MQDLQPKLLQYIAKQHVAKLRIIIHVEWLDFCFVTRATQIRDAEHVVNNSMARMLENGISSNINGFVVGYREFETDALRVL
jgi:hypothetical protein